MSDQETEQEKDGQATPEEGADAAKEADVDSLSDLAELEKIKAELQKEKEKAAKELEEGEEDEEDLREVDYLQKLLGLSIKFEHHVGMWLMTAYIDCGIKYDHRLAESYMTQLSTIQSFLRLLEKVDGVTRELVTKDCVLKLRNVVQMIYKNQVKPLYKEVSLMKKKPKSESLEHFKENWNERLEDLQKACDFEYQVLDVKGFILK
ncbi:MAG: hypothetical protein G3M78_06495 [Candidatus Nitrohelix vancouverensis]|uniref:Uncharacterized protein n=1 Tax=Candidatus Nitrohelix vancouverensis TaxID=2705534 RepID=A0A7T0G3A9_9BACT|nr:MAG: hypothetical protein G3M78_06495 [Candidatus Nitrohelix vancouverensis]